MKLWDIVKKVGSRALRDAVPGAGLVLDAVNAVLPEPLPENATGHDIEKATAGLPPAEREALWGRHFDVEVVEIEETHDTLRTMLESDAANPQTTRPRIALGAFRVVAFCCIAVVSVWCVGVLRSDEEIVRAAQGGAQFVLFVIAPLTTLLLAYFGVLKTEHRNKLDAASGSRELSGGLSGMLSRLIRQRK